MSTMKETIVPNASNLEIFQEFSGNLKETNNVTQSLIEVSNNLFYIYERDTGNVLVTRTLSFIHQLEYNRYQVFQPRSQPRGEVRALRVSCDGARVALLSSVGVYAVHLPHVWSCCILPSSLSNVSTTDPWLVEPGAGRAAHEVLQARWHPACPRHLVVLFSDNFLRLMDTGWRVLLHVLPLVLPGPCPRTPVYEPVPLAVDFDFGPPLVKWSIQKQKAGTELPILVLRANAECLYAILTPGREMLYEVGQAGGELGKWRDGGEEVGEVSSVTVLPSKPPVVVIGFTNGLLYHSILIAEGDYKTLVPFERLEINFGILGNKKFKSQLIFIRDLETTNRFFILHDAGIHCITLPVVPELEAFFLGDNLKEGILKLKIALKKMGSAVKDMLCTQLPGMTGRNPLYGAGVISAALKTIALMVVLSDGTPLPLSVDPWPSHNQLMHDPMRESFSEAVREFLQGSNCLRPPLFRLNLEHSTLTGDVLNFLVGYIHALREAKASRHAFVSDIIEIKIQNIICIFNKQLRSTIALTAEKEALRLNAERIAERYEEEKEKFIVLQSRLERIGVALNVPSTVVEENANTELQEMQRRAVQLAAIVQQFQACFEQSQLQRQINQSNLADDSSVLNKNQLHKIYSRLKDMEQTIMDLMDKLATVQMNILYPKKTDTFK